MQRTLHADNPVKETAALPGALAVSPTVVVVQPDVSVAHGLEEALSEHGYAVTRTESGREALQLSAVKPVDLFVLDTSLPDVDGLAVCRTIKSDPLRAHIAVVLLSSRASDDDIVLALDLGADDYIVKPYSVPVLLARLRLVLRRRGDFGESQTILKVREVALHQGRQEVTVAGMPVSLTTTEYGILRLLLLRPGWARSRQAIVEEVWGDADSVTGRSVDVHILNLRRKLGESGSDIETIRGYGYRYRDR